MTADAVTPEDLESKSAIPQRPSTREALIFGAGALLLLVAEALTSGPAILFGRYLYIDELWVKFIDSDPNLWRSLATLEHSGDFTPPLYHILIRATWWLVGGSGETAFRALALAGMWATLLLLYILLRRAFGVLPALVSVLAFWSNPLIIHYAFFARPYPLLLAATAGFCLAYEVGDSSPWSMARTAAAAVLVCTIHYFGIFAFASVVVGDALARGATLRSLSRRMLPVAAGPLALLTLIPFYRGQLAGFSHPSWLPPVTADYAIGTIVDEFGFPILIATLLTLTWWVSEMLRPRSMGLETVDHATPGSASLQSMAGFSALLLVPLFVTLFSVMDRTNAVVDRYMMTALLGVIPLLAMIASRSATRVLIAVTAFLVLFSWWNVSAVENAFAAWHNNRAQLFKDCLSITDDLPIVTLNTHEAFILYEYAPSLKQRLFVVDLREEFQNDSIVVSVDYEATNKWRTIYPDMPKLVTLNDLRRMGEFHVLRESEAIVHPSGPPPFQRVRGHGWNTVYQVHPD